MRAKKCNPILMLGRALPILALELLWAAGLPAMADEAPRYVRSALTIAPLSAQDAIPTAGMPMHRRVHRRMPHRFESLYPLLIPSLALPKAIPPMLLPEALQPTVTMQLTGLAFPGLWVHSAASEYPVELSSPFETTLLKLRHDHGSLADSQVDYMDTTFSEQVRLPLFRLWSGHLEFGAFDNDRSMDNILLGPQRTGGLLNISNLLLPAHQGKRAPVDEVSYGMMLSFHLRSHGEWGPHIHGWRCLGWAIGSGRGCRLD